MAAALRLSPEEEEQATRAVIRAKCENDFRFFVRYFFKHQKGSNFVFSWHHERICRALMRVYNGATTHLIINIPLRYSKTELCVKLFSAWCFVKRADAEFIHLSYSDPLALDNSQQVKDILKSQAFRELWPHIGIKNNKDSKKTRGTEQGGVFYATAAGDSVTGFGAGKFNDFDDSGSGFGGAIIIDDPLKPDDAHSDPVRSKINRRWDEKLSSLVSIALKRRVSSLCSVYMSLISAECCLKTKNTSLSN